MAADKFRAVSNRFYQARTIPEDVYSSMKTIDGLNGKTYQSKKMLDELMPGSGEDKTKQEYLGNYNRTTLDSLIQR